tara:strand:+ start:2551 stop:2772 length:222 start_codon:yes stop_codon:yes gene_type:complete
MPRNYRKEYDNYQGTPEQRKRNDQRKKARRKMVKAGRAKKGDGKDVHHRDSNPFNNSLRNLTILTASRNRSIK